MLCRQQRPTVLSKPQEFGARKAIEKFNLQTMATEGFLSNRVQCNVCVKRRREPFGSVILSDTAFFFIIS
jgi:hypothetical protein